MRPESNFLHVLSRRIVPVAPVGSEPKTLLYEPAAEWMVNGSNPDADTQYPDPKKGRERRPLKQVVRPACWPGRIVAHQTRSANDEDVTLPQCPQTCRQVLELAEQVL